MVALMFVPSAVWSVMPDAVSALALAAAVLGVAFYATPGQARGMWRRFAGAGLVAIALMVGCQTLTAAPAPDQVLTVPPGSVVIVTVAGDTTNIDVVSICHFLSSTEDPWQWWWFDCDTVMGGGR